ncbi:MAG TPA: FYDLN acid domain-containing protein [Thermoanaerobaculia bacterium]|nr:FYDLN acid domain-containing protein [Thermoanaerobaculia bacterium]
MATNLGKKYDCYSCHTKFYDLGKPDPLCPKCGANQKDAEDSAPAPSSRSRRVVEVPVEEDFGEEAETPAAAPDEDEEEAVVEPVEGESDDDDDDDEEE